MEMERRKKPVYTLMPRWWHYWYGGRTSDGRMDCGNSVVLVTYFDAVALPLSLYISCPRDDDDDYAAIAMLFSFAHSQ